jgi:hypothetical protein
MKTKKISFLVAVFVLTTLLLISTAFAAWYTCTITKVGANASAYVVFLTDTAATPKFTNRWFVLEPARAKELLAIALTAHANGKKLQVALGSVAAGSTVVGAYVMD